jgi:hypothetical protein
MNRFLSADSRLDFTQFPIGLRREIACNPMVRNGKCRSQGCLAAENDAYSRLNSLISGNF